MSVYFDKKSFQMIFCFLLGLTSAIAKPSIHPYEAIVVYNAKLPEAKAFAKHYATERYIPQKQIIPLDGLSEKTSSFQTISRADFNEKILHPLRRVFKKNNWASKDTSNRPIKLIILIRGIPYRIKNSAKPTLPDNLPKGQKLPTGLFVDGASVDADLSYLIYRDRPLAQLYRNEQYGKSTFNVDEFCKSNIMVGRIDAPRIQQCYQMLQDSLYAERNGLHGMLYSDHRSIKKPNYILGDNFMKKTATVGQSIGMPVSVDPFPEYLSTDYPIDNVAAYFGWYTSRITGAFSDPDFRFNSGAIACMLHSTNIQNHHQENNHWTGGAIQRGAAVTLGTVSEPYLGLYYDFGRFFEYASQGKSVIESAYYSIPYLSWMHVTFGDPLYRPFRKSYTLNATAGTALYEEKVGLDLMMEKSWQTAFEQFETAKTRYKNELNLIGEVRQWFNQCSCLRQQNEKQKAAEHLRRAKRTFTGQYSEKAFDIWINRLDPPKKEQKTN